MCSYNLTSSSSSSTSSTTIIEKTVDGFLNWLKNKNDLDFDEIRKKLLEMLTLYHQHESKEYRISLEQAVESLKLNFCFELNNLIKKYEK